MIKNDNELVNEVLSGNINSFGKLITKYQNIMYNLSIQILQDKDLAKDVIQDVFIKVYQSLNKFDQSKKFFSWIYRITLNESLNQQKRSKYFENIDNVVLTTHENINKKIEDSEVSDKIKSAILQLSPKYQSLIILKHYQNLSYDEISEILDIPVGKVKSRLYMARGILKNTLGGLKND